MSNESKPASKPGDTPHSLHAVVRGLPVHIHTTPPPYVEHRFGYTKHGHGRHYISVGTNFNPGDCINKAWDRRCDASRWAKRAGAKTITHWYQC